MKDGLSWSEQNSAVRGAPTVPSVQVACGGSHCLAVVRAHSAEKVLQTLWALEKGTEPSHSLANEKQKLTPQASGLPSQPVS